MPTITVILPSYNHEKFISDAIESVLNQTFTDFELIIIDDASEDRSKEIINAYEKKDNRIRAFFHDDNMGIAKTINEGIEKANGKFISFFSSDDVWISNKLEKQLDILKKNEELVVWSEGLLIDAQGNPTGETFTQKCGALKKKNSGDIFEEMFKGNYICSQSVILKRENLEDIKFNEQLKYLNDYKLMADLARKYKFHFIPEPLIMYRIHGKNSILSDSDGWQKDRIIINECFLKEYGDNIPNKKKSLIFLSTSIGYTYFGEKAKARQYVYHGIKLNPFCYRNVYYLIFAIFNKDGAIHNFLRIISQNYPGRKK